MRTIHYLTLAILILAALVSVPAMAASFSFHEEDDGETIDVSTGDWVKISLPENPSTGFRWIVSTIGPISLINDDYISSASGGMGAGGTRTWTYIVKNKGTIEFHGIYKQSWMPTTGEEQTFDLTLNSAQTRGRKTISLERFRRFPLSSAM